jgi:hypothetical protein
MVGGIAQLGRGGKGVRRFVAAGALLVQLVAIPAVGAETPEPHRKPAIVELSTRLEDGRATVSFRVENALSEEALERIDSGIQVAFRLMPAKVLARTVIHTRARYDALTRRYTLERVTEFKGPHKKQAPPPADEQRFTTSADEMRAWMTELENIAVYDPVEPFAEDDQLKVRADSSLGRRYALYVFPTSVTASAEQPLGR